MLDALFLALAANAGPVVAVEPAMVEPNPKVMNQTQIRQHNTQLPRAHPYYIRCVKSPELGSLVKKTYSCRTNHQWKQSDEKGNENARELMDEMASKFWKTSN